MSADQNGEGKVFVGLSLTQTTTDRFTLHIRAKDISSQSQTSNTLKVSLEILCYLGIVGSVS